MISFRTLLVSAKQFETGMFAILILFLSGSCSSLKSTALQPDKMPFRFQNIMKLAADNIVLADFDCDGFTEIVTIFSLPDGQAYSHLQFLTFEGKIIEQVNYTGKIINTCFTLDSNDDGILELMVP